MTELPSSVYVVVGILVITNLSTVGALVVFIFKCGMFVSETKSGIRDAREAAIRAHKRIDGVQRHLILDDEGSENVDEKGAER